MNILANTSDWDSLTASSAGAHSIQSVFSDDTQGNTRQSRRKPDAANTMQILQNPTVKGAPPDDLA